LGQLDNPEFIVLDTNGNSVEDHNIEFLGWAPNLEYPDVVVTSSYIPQSDMDLYAVFMSTEVSYD